MAKVKKAAANIAVPQSDAEAASFVRTIRLLKKAGLTRFIRTKEEVNKDAMLASKEDRELANGIKGITIGSDGEDFSIEPAEAEAPAL